MRRGERQNRLHLFENAAHYDSSVVKSPDRVLTILAVSEHILLPSTPLVRHRNEPYYGVWLRDAP
jgi:hypothetical protein